MTMWVFGYGSLLWNPGFDVAEMRVASLRGYQRSFCMRSIHHRGTVANPGLVLALDESEKASCHGVGFAVREGQEDEVLAYLRERELVSAAYLEKHVEIVFAGGGSVEALAYVIDAEHEQYCGGLDLEEQAQIIARAQGGRGPNHEYLINTAEHLSKLGITDHELDELVRRVKFLL
ncbi:gamma-glutamylcyclotransferase [Lentibacter algarum]|uniref:gamma-glutamylcyclotransferase n=1 Tax=Lentibacter algarum TaxID=576131 RepID=UPI001C092C0E|nr:gamma-glutamylcyclotransferase [Lentibacter algarum]MBU2982991.1 gamma-glutamylcyclotransferase [Lentibacter algarum]